MNARAPDPIRIVIMVAVAAIVILRLGSWFSGAPARRPTPQKPAGTAALAGTVIDESGAPIADVEVSLDADTIGQIHSLTTGADGAFVFDKLRAGTYRIDAYRNRRVTFRSSASAGQAHAAVRVADGQRRDGIAIRLPRGGTIEGFVYDEAGKTAAGRYVRAMRRQRVFEEWRLEELPIASTDAAGRYRVDGLAAGEYIIMASLDPSEVRRVYYPNVPRPSDATPVRLSAGDVRTGVNLHARPIPTAEVTGVIRREDGSPAEVIVSLVRAGDLSSYDRMLMGSSGADGKFKFDAVPADKFWIVAHSSNPATGRPDPLTAPLLRGIVDVESDGTRPVRLDVTVARGRTVSGRLKFTRPAGDVKLHSRVIRLLGRDPRSNAQLGAASLSAEAGADGSFSIAGVPPGTYSFANSYFDNWWLDKVTMAGRQLVDETFTVAAGSDVDGLELSLVDNPGSVAGRVQSAAGQPVSGRMVLAFITDASRWTRFSRRVSAVETSVDGEFEVRFLPAGEYFVAALDGADAGRSVNREMLARLAAKAARISVANGNRLIHHIRVPR